MTTVSYKKKLVTVPVLTLKDNTPRQLRFDDQMFVGKQMKETDPEKKKKEPATLVNVTDIETGEKHQLIVNAVLHSILDEEYPNNSYVGKTFEIERLPKREGKAYNGFKVFELIADGEPHANNIADAHHGSAKQGKK